MSILEKLSAFRHHVLGKPFFYGGLQSHRAPYMKLVAAFEVSRLGRPLNILEVGSYRGASAALWSAFGHVTCIDLWPDGPGLFVKNLSLLGLHCPENYIYHRGDSWDVMAMMVDYKHKFDLVYIDADHTREKCSSDLHLGQALVRDGGILCGDDLEFQQHELTPGFREKMEDFWWHPGVTEAVHEAFGPVWCKNGFYVVRPGMNGFYVVRPGSVFP